MNAFDGNGAIEVARGERAVLVVPEQTGRGRSGAVARRSAEARLDEAQGLAEAIGIKIVARHSYRLRSVRPATLLGKGQVEEIAATGVDAVGLDWTVNLGKARERVAGKVALQGNLDPTILFAPPAAVREQARAVLDSYGNHPGHVFNLGHGISQFTSPDHVAELVDEVHSHSRAIRSGAAG